MAFGDLVLLAILLREFSPFELGTSATVPVPFVNFGRRHVELLSQVFHERLAPSGLYLEELL